MTIHQRRTVLKGLGAGAALLIGGTGTVLANDHRPDSAGDEAGLRVAHASPDAPAVDIYVDGAKAVADLAFGTVTEYLELPSGEYDIAVNVAGTTTTVFSADDVALAAEDYTAVALGEVFGDDTEFTISLFEDTNGANIGDDEARVRAIHASPDAPAVDVTVNGGALTLFDGVAFGESSGYTVVPAASYDVEIRPDTADNDGPVVFEAAGVSLSGGSTYTVFALGYLGDTPAFYLLPNEDVSTPPRSELGRGRGSA